jgi:hypothetical protein
METWYKRRDASYKEQLQVMDKMYLRDIGVAFIPSLFPYGVPTTATHLDIIEHTARQYGTLIVTITKECDAEIAKYANLNSRVIAILADDTDFLIFAGAWRYFSIKDMKPWTSQTKEYSRVALRRHLELNDDELVLLSTLNGNDVIQFDDAKQNFHRKLLEGQQYWLASVRFPALARFARRNLPTDNHDELVRVIATRIFMNANAISIAKVEESLNFYRTDFEIKEITNPLHKFCLDNYYDFVFPVLKGLPKTFIVSYYDMRVSDFPNLFEANMKLFRKQIGITLKADKRFMRYRVTTKVSHDTGYKTIYVEPDIPFQDLPPVLELLQRDLFPAHDPLRFKLLKWTISKKGKFCNFDLEQVPSRFLHDILTLTFLVSENFITVQEADMILLTVKRVEDNDVPANIPIPRYLDPRGFRIAFLYSKFFLYIGRSLEVTGLKMLSVSKILSTLKFTY